MTRRVSTQVPAASDLALNITGVQIAQLSVDMAVALGLNGTNLPLITDISGKRLPASTTRTYDDTTRSYTATVRSSRFDPQPTSDAEGGTEFS